MPNYPQQFCDALLAEARRGRFGGSFPPPEQGLAQLSGEEIWRRPNANSNSVGNLVLHLCGNARQWIISGLGGQPDTRQRQKEFDEPGPLPAAQLMAMLDKLQQDIEATLQEVDPPELLRRRLVQTFEETGLSILVHAVEHFSYHTGQITYFVKLHKDLDMKYYTGVDLE